MLIILMITGFVSHFDLFGYLNDKSICKTFCQGNIFIWKKNLEFLEQQCILSSDSQGFQKIFTLKLVPLRFDDDQVYHIKM